MKICPECKSTLSTDEDIFCYRDGSRLEAPARCDNCSRMLSPVDKFCPRCGTAVKQ